MTVALLALSKIACARGYAANACGLSVNRRASCTLSTDNAATSIACATSVAMLPCAVNGSASATSVDAPVQVIVPVLVSTSVGVTRARQVPAPSFAQRTTPSSRYRTASSLPICCAGLVVPR